LLPTESIGSDTTPAVGASQSESITGSNATTLHERHLAARRQPGWGVAGLAPGSLGYVNLLGALLIIPTSIAAAPRRELSSSCSRCS
jgi:hypothetical protein